jgi:hypothetical protein
MNARESASSGLAYIMRYHGASFWENAPDGNFLIHAPIPGSGGKTKACKVSKTQVERAARDVEAHRPPSRYVRDIGRQRYTG